MNMKTVTTIFDLPPGELASELASKSLPEEEIKQRYPHIQEMDDAADAAIRELQAKGILDNNGRLIPPKELPLDMRPQSSTEC